MDSQLAQSTALLSIQLPYDEAEYDSTAKELVSSLKKTPPRDIKVDGELAAIQPDNHTILFAYCLVAAIEASASSGKATSKQVPSAVLPDGAAWQPITQILLEFDPVQARYCGSQLLKIVDWVVQGAEQTSNYVPAIQLLHHFILRLDSSSSTLTSSHRAFVRLCLLAQAYDDATSILDKTIYHIPPQQIDARSVKYLCSETDQTWLFLGPTTGLSQQITSRIYLEYYLYGAMCYMALRRYKEAKLFLEVVLTAPTQQSAASQIMVEAYKKWLLVGLLLHGQAIPPPKNINTNASRTLVAMAKPYDCIAQAYKSSNMDQLRAEFEAAVPIMEEDGNYGLLGEVYQAIRKFAVLKLGKTFAALPIAEVARRTSLDPDDVAEMKTYLEGLISDGALNATITDDSNGGQVLRFLASSKSSMTEPQVESALASRSQELQILLKQIQDTEHRLEISKEYTDFLKKLKKNKEEAKKSHVSKSTVNQSTVDDEDEDMMEEY